VANLPAQSVDHLSDFLYNSNDMLDATDVILTVLRGNLGLPPPLLGHFDNHHEYYTMSAFPSEAAIS